jgi:hypothetical protein
MAAFDLGLACISFVVVWILQSCETCSPDVRPPKWPLALLAGLFMLIGGQFTSRFEPPTEHVVRRFIRRALMPPLVPFCIVAFPSALIFMSAKGIEIQLVAGTLLTAAVGFALPALAVTAIWALVYVGVERRIAAR